MKTFKKILDLYTDEADLIEEYCGDTFIDSHTAFSIGEDDESNFLFLHGSSWENPPTKIDIHQEVVKIENNRVFVYDTCKNLIDLQFFISRPLTIPNESNP